MTTARPVSPIAMRRKVEAWLADPADQQPAMALRARPEWTGEPVLTVDGQRVRIVATPSTIAMRAALHDRSDDERLVLLTELSAAELGDGLLAHLSKWTVRSVDQWELVRQLFSTDILDPTLTTAKAGGGSWLAEALAQYLPREGWPKPTGSILTREHALRCLTAELLGVDREQMDSAGLLRWSTDATAQMAFRRLPEEVIAGVTRFLAESAGVTAGPIMAAVRAGHGVDVISLGLLCGILWTSQTTPAAVARARLEPWFGGTRLTDAQADQLAAAAEAWVIRTGEINRQDVEPLLRRAETIAAEVDASALLTGSDLLPAGFTYRMRDFAQTVQGCLAVTGPAVASGVLAAQRAFAIVERHRLPLRRSLDTARMAMRLLRWLASNDSGVPVNLLDAIQRQIQVDGWVDRARLDVFNGDGDPVVSQAYQALHRAVDARRANHDHQFATLLAQATSAEAQPGSLLRVEDVLEKLVRPLINHGRRVLLLVMDGMSVAAMTELAESLTRTGPWLEVTPGGGPRIGVLAALPTVTEVSRCSLFSGRIARGQAAQEREALSERFPGSILLHKGRLRAAAGHTLDPEVRSALEDRQISLVAAVVNTIDDALDRSEPGYTVWDADSIPAVTDLLASAQDRIVILLSDHGHVIDRGSEAVHLGSSSSENRWRPADQPPRDGEIQVRGSRVLTPDQKVVLPWREGIRYGPRKAGYHGGASAAEVVIPLLVLSAGDDTVLPGWSGAPVASPDWWRESLVDTGIPASPPSRKPSRQAPAQVETLWDEQPSVMAAPPLAPRARSALVKALLESDIYAARRTSRAGLADERVAALVQSLLDAPGRRLRAETLAAKAGIPVHRTASTLTALRRLLQVEGYPVIDIDPDGQTVLLDEQLLREQFGLG